MLLIDRDAQFDETIKTVISFVIRERYKEYKTSFIIVKSG